MKPIYAEVLVVRSQFEQLKAALNAEQRTCTKAVEGSLARLEKGLEALEQRTTKRRTVNRG